MEHGATWKQNERLCAVLSGKLWKLNTLYMKQRIKERGNFGKQKKLWNTFQFYNIPLHWKMHPRILECCENSVWHWNVIFVFQWFYNVDTREGGNTHKCYKNISSHNMCVIKECLQTVCCTLACLDWFFSCCYDCLILTIVCNINRIKGH